MQNALKFLTEIFKSVDRESEASIYEFLGQIYS